MLARIVGAKSTDFNGRDGKVKMQKYHCVLDSSPDVDTGSAVDFLTWNEMEKGNPPAIEIGAIYEVQYSKSGKLSFVEPVKPAKTA